MEMKEIMKLIQAVSDYNLTSFDLEEGEMKISLKREKEIVQQQIVLPQAAPAAAVMQAGAVMPAQAGFPAASADSDLNGALNASGAALSGMAQTGAADAIGSDQVVSSPLVGIFYSSSSPDAEAFVKVGDTVKKGQVLGIVEAMKLMNEIESEFDGVVEAVLVNNEDVVEYGQPLFRIK